MIQTVEWLFTYYDAWFEFVSLKTLKSRIYCSLLSSFVFMAADTAFDWIVITSPQAGSVFLEAWK
jgi:uroporphyrinogen-III synthase